MADNMPSCFNDTSLWETVNESQLADPVFNILSSIDLLIGAAQCEDAMIGNKKLKEPNIAITNRLSMFGWVVIGKEQTAKIPSKFFSETFFVQSEPVNVKCFWEKEEVLTAKFWTSEEKLCVEHFNETTKLTVVF